MQPQSGIPTKLNNIQALEKVKRFVFAVSSYLWEDYDNLLLLFGLPSLELR